MKTYPEFEDARAACTDDEMVCGVQLKDGTPLHFVMAREAPDEEIADVAFLIREGRRPSEHEKWLMTMAQRMRAKVPA